MTLIVSELRDLLFQVITPNENIQVEAIRIHLYKHNSPTGTFTLQIRDTNNRIVAASSESFEASDFSSAAFFHGQVRFYLKAYVQKGRQYRVCLVPTGYSFSESAYLGWCNSYDLLSYNTSYEYSNDLEAPLSLEIWSFKK